MLPEQGEEALVARKSLVVGLKSAVELLLLLTTTYLQCLAMLYLIQQLAGWKITFQMQMVLLILVHIPEVSFKGPSVVWPFYT